MKKTLSVLAVAALSLGVTTSYAKEIILKPYGDLQSPVVSQVIAPGATLINSETGNVVVYDLNDNPKVEPPFDDRKGQIQWGLNLANKYNEPLSLEDVAETAADSAIRITEGDTLVLDFTSGALTLGGPTETEYMVLMFRTRDAFGNDFAEWYSANEVPIIARFTNGDYLAYVIDDACDRLKEDEHIPGLMVPNTYSTMGGLVFFNEEVAPAVSLAEVDPDTITPDPEPSPAVPEPTTATLSLLALAGLAARRRRK